MSTATTSPAQAVQEDQVFVMNNVEWGQYVAVNDALSERAGLRMTYLDGRLTLVSPTRRHEWHSDVFDGIVKAVANGCGIDWEPAVSTTYRVEELEAGVEGDRTYYFGQHAILMGGPTEVDLATQPPPDLAIEIEYTNPVTDALVIYDRLGVPEVWRYNVKKDALTFLHRKPEGGYEPAPRSLALPMLGPDDVLGQLRRSAEMKSSRRWSEQLAAWVRDVILPRLDRAR